MQFDEKDLYQEDRPAPRSGSPLLLLACALLIGAAWCALLMHQRVASRAARAAGAAAAPESARALALAPDPEARPAPVPPAPSESRRRFYGVVFDLATKKPVSGAQVILAGNAEGAAINLMPCQTDLNGHYACDIWDSFAAVWVQVSSTGYRGQFEDFFPTLRKRQPAERRAVLAQKDGYLEPARVVFTAGQEVVPLDLVVVPAAWLPQAQSER